MSQSGELFLRGRGNLLENEKLLIDVVVRGQVFSSKYFTRIFCCFSLTKFVVETMGILEIVF